MATALPDLESDIVVAKELADAARTTALEYFRSNTLQIGNKRAEDGAFDPVTVADKEVEAVIRSILAEKRPSDGILGEEHKDTSGTSGRTWVIDPIDGTRAFMCGLPTWGVLIALNDDPTAFATSDDFDRFSALSKHTRLTRYGTDCYGYAMLARGQIDLVVESGLQPYDIQAMIPIVQAAGGFITNWQGDDCQDGGRVIAAADAALHAAALDKLSE